MTSSVLTPQQRRVPAAGSTPPVTGAPNSVFAAGQAAKTKREYKRAAPLDVSTVQIKSGVAIPPVVLQRPASRRTRRYSPA